MARSVVLIMPAEYAGKKRPIALPPLNMLYLASHLKHRGFDVTVFDQQVDLASPNEYAELVAERSPDLVGMTSYTPGVANALQVARAIKAKTPDIPIVMGGDDSIPIPVLAAYHEHGPITILQLDAHIDWRDEVAGETQGLSSNMRRASEMNWVENIIQVGARGVDLVPHQIGNARPGEQTMRQIDALGRVGQHHSVMNAG